MTGNNSTERLRAILGDAAGQAQHLNHEYIGTEHLLLALLAAKQSCAATALENLGVDLEAAANRLLTVLRPGRSQHDASSGALLPFTSRAKKVMELAAEEARTLNHSYMGTEHLLLGMIGERKGIAAQVLFEAGVGLENARAEVLRILGTELEPARSGTSEVPADEPPSRVAVVLEYGNGAIVSEHFKTTRAAIDFLEAQRCLERPRE